MNKPHYLALLTGLPLAALVAWRVGGSVGVGAFTGACLGLGLSFAGLAAQQWAHAHRPKLVMALFGAAFFAKLVFLTAGALVLRFDESLGERCDWSAYLLGFIAAVLWTLSFGAARGLRSAFPTKELRTP